MMRGSLLRRRLTCLASYVVPKRGKTGPGAGCCGKAKAAEPGLLPYTRNVSVSLRSRYPGAALFSRLDRIGDHPERQYQLERIVQ